MAAFVQFVCDHCDRGSDHQGDDLEDWPPGWLQDYRGELHCPACQAVLE